ncbi:BAG domain-containing protein Samui [Daktulosphaira vitifoliae]|uniref:BAG domain-containing protein Samui n=1 Tax=Daktulosphaira vitifoliae TaxID=58002 RepID=UPI0021AA4D8E|nr:BAG domain-containing protein Samui [Daktulosphaira vitifoliae]
MPFGERFNKFKPKLSERIRGKTTNEILEEIKKNFNNNTDSNMDFDNVDSNSIERNEFPFDDEILNGHLSVRSHLEDLAKRHPDIANHLRCPPWEGEPSSKRWNKKKSDSEEKNISEEPSNLNSSYSESVDSNSCQKPEDNMSQHQNTDNNLENLDNNDEKPQRFVSKLEFTPVNPNNQTENTDLNQEQQPQQQQSQQQQKDCQKNTTPPQGGQKQPNVRHIPIFVEGRSEPVYPKNIDKVLNNSMGSNKSKPNSGRQSPFKNHHSFYDQNNVHHRQTPPPPPQHQQAASQDSRSTQSPPPTRQQTQIDALDKVQIVQAEVEELGKAVDIFSGNSRNDKQYIYLDEMLTRNLIKLDTIETEGRDDVRIARKKAIKTIQDTIAVLEDKVPQSKTEPIVVDESNENSIKLNQVDNSTDETNSETNTESVKN